MSDIVGEGDISLSWVWFVVGLIVVIILTYMGVLPWGV